MKYTLGTIEASEKLITDLYINLRNEVNAWAEITYQTPQARMGYIGQHLVSVVAGYHGGKSGARGRDLLMKNGGYGEIKTCYRVDQLGKCSKCEEVVSSLEKECSNCGSKNIIRRDDSKWLIGIRHDEEFASILEPESYFFVLFEFEELNNIDNDNIIASIWEVNPKNKGFGYCMIDYYLNTRANCKSKAPYNMWPYSFKFMITQPKLIYRSLINGDGTINTSIFPTMGNGYIDELLPLQKYSQAKTITVDIAKRVLLRISPDEKNIEMKKGDILKMIEKIRSKSGMSNAELCDIFAEEVYMPLIERHKDKIPHSLKKYYTELR